MLLQNVALQATRLASNCAGRCVRDLELNSRMHSTWNTGAFTSVELRGWGGKSELVGIEVPDALYVAELRFEIECLKPGDAKPSKVGVMFAVADSYGVRTQLSIVCPPEIYDKLDFDSLQHGMPMQLAHAQTPDEHPVCCTYTLAEDIPHCREIAERLCRELTAQLESLGYWLRPVKDNAKRAVVSENENTEA